MRLVSFGDVHMALGAVALLAPELGRADLAIVTGDITTFQRPARRASSTPWGGTVPTSSPSPATATSFEGLTRQNSEEEPRTTSGLERSSRTPRVPKGLDAVGAQW